MRMLECLGLRAQSIGFSGSAFGGEGAGVEAKGSWPAL